MEKAKGKWQDWCGSGNGGDYQVRYVKSEGQIDFCGQRLPTAVVSSSTPAELKRAEFTPPDGGARDDHPQCFHALVVFPLRLWVR